jgi:hypothetical protein
LQITQRGSPAFRFDVFGNQLIDRWLTFFLSQSGRCNQHGKNERDYQT